MAPETDLNTQEDSEDAALYDMDKLRKGIQRHLWIIALCSILAASLALYTSYKFLTTYKAQAVLVFQEANKEATSGLTLVNFTLATALDTIKLPSNFQAVKSILGLNEPVGAIAGMIDVPNPRSESNLITIIAQSKDPNLAVNLANTLAQVAVKSSQEFTVRQLQAALQNFINQLDSTKQRLSSQLKELEEFKTQHQYFDMTTENSSTLKELAETKRALLNAELTYNGSLVEYENLKRKIAELPAGVRIRNSALQSQILSLQAAISEARSKYAPENPKLLKMEDELRNLQNQPTDQGDLGQSGTSDKDSLELELIRMQGRVRSAQKKRQDLAQKVHEIEESLSNLPGQQVAFARLLQAKAITEDQVRFLTKAIENTQLLINVPHGSLELYQAAMEAKPSRDSILVYLLPFAGLIAGMIGGTILALFLEARDKKIRTAKQVGIFLSLPCWLTVPAIANLTPENSDKKLIFFIRQLEELLEGISKERHVVSFQSTQEDEGKSTFAYNLAKYCAGIGRKTLLMSLDPHPNPYLRERDDKGGLEAYLNGIIDIHDLIHETSPAVIHLGKINPNMKELLKTKKMDDLWIELKNKYEWIIVDAPSVITEDFAVNLAHQCTQNILVVDSSATSTNLAQESLQIFEKGKAPLSGVILNKVLPLYIDDARIKRLLKSLCLVFLLFLQLTCITGCYRRPEVIVSPTCSVISYDKYCPFSEPTPRDLCFEEEICAIVDMNEEAPEPKLEEFRFEIGDNLDVGVFGDNETAVDDAIVAPDGNLYYLFLDAIRAEGRTATELANAISEHLEDYYLDPLISVVPKSSVGRTFTVLGRVYYPGVFPLPAPIRLRDALAIAGGVITTTYEDFSRSTIFSLADLENSFIIRNNHKLPVNFTALLNTPDNDDNIPIMPGDYIYIAPASHRHIFVLGALANPQRMVWIDGMTAMEAVSLAGGWLAGNPYSMDITKLLVIRGALENPCVMQLDLTLVLRGEARDIFLIPGDIVFAQNKTMRFGRELVRLAIATFLQSFGSAAGSYYGQFRWFN